MRFSFEMCLYKEKGTIGTALESLAQKLKDRDDAEVLIGIEGEDDGTYGIVKGYAKRFKHIRIYRFKNRTGRFETVNFLIGKARGEIVVNHDADRIFVADLDVIKKLFRDKRVGGLVHMDTSYRDSINDGQRIFEETYSRILAERHLVGNEAREPIFECHIYRKSALKRPYLQTRGADDVEIVQRLLSAGYKVIYDKRVAYALPDNPKMPRLTVSGVFRRRLRSLIFKEQKKRILNSRSYIGLKGPDAVRAAFAAISEMDVKEFLGFVEYAFIVVIAVILAKLQISMNKGLIETAMPGWKYKAR